MGAEAYTPRVYSDLEQGKCVLCLCIWFAAVRTGYELSALVVKVNMFGTMVQDYSS